MAKPVSCGLLLFRRRLDGVEVLLVHPSGPYNRNAPWSIPKGLADPDEKPEETAKRETLEETGIVASGPLTPLGAIDYTKSRKTIVAFAGEAASTDVPRCASWEVDRAEFVPLSRAHDLIHPDQRPFLDRLVDTLGT